MIRAYDPADLTRIELAPGHQEIAARPGVLEALGVLSQNRHASTSLAGAAVVAILGLAPDAEDPGACEVFIFPSRWAAHNAITLFRDVSAELRRIQKEFLIVRAITRDEPKANRFLAHLGFVREGFRSADGMLVWVHR